MAIKTRPATITEEIKCCDFCEGEEQMNETDAIEFHDYVTKKDYHAHKKCVIEAINKEGARRLKKDKG